MDYLNTLERVYVVDAFVNWDIKVGLRAWALCV